MNSHVVLIAFIKSSKINDIDIEMPNEAIISQEFAWFMINSAWFYIGQKKKLVSIILVVYIPILNSKYPYQSLVVLCYNKTITYFE